VRARRHQTTSARIREAISEDRLSLDSQPISTYAPAQVERHELLLRDDRERRRALPAAAFIRAPRRPGWCRSWTAGSSARRSGCSPSARAAGEPDLRPHQHLRRLFHRLLRARVHRAQAGRGEADPRGSPSRSPRARRSRTFDTAASFADRLSEFGCQVAIDDYGAGCGPFYYLKHLPFDMIKIDGDFVRDLPRNDADQLTVLAIVQIARGLGKRTIAGFVQDDETANMLRDYGVDMARASTWDARSQSRPCAN
jgi:EAL domain-containing protein (putative c-di-GMP-specific phosphodiesterase class I)